MEYVIWCALGLGISILVVAGIFGEDNDVTDWN